MKCSKRSAPASSRPSSRSQKTSLKSEYLSSRPRTHSLTRWRTRAGHRVTLSRFGPELTTLTPVSAPQWFAWQVDSDKLTWCRSAGVRRASIIACLEKSHLKVFFDTYIASASPERAKLAVLFWSQRLQSTTLRELVDVVELAAPGKLPAAKELAESKPTRTQVEAFVRSLDPLVQGEFDQILSGLVARPPLPAGSEEISADQASVDAFRQSLLRADRYRPALDLTTPVEPSRL